MRDYLPIIGTGCILIALLFIITTLGKKQMEPMIVMPIETDVLLDLPTRFKLKNTYAKIRPLSTMSSFEQTTNNSKMFHPENGTTLLPELSGFYN
jgi:hypothetical protein